MFTKLKLDYIILVKFKITYYLYSNYQISWGEFHRHSKLWRGFVKVAFKVLWGHRPHTKFRVKDKRHQIYYLLKVMVDVFFLRKQYLVYYVIYVCCMYLVFYQTACLSSFGCLIMVKRICLYSTWFYCEVFENFYILKKSLILSLFCCLWIR